MFETAVLGVIGSGRIRQCVECQAASRDGFDCTGFGAGCFLPRREAPAVAAPAKPLIGQGYFKR